MSSNTKSAADYQVYQKTGKWPGEEKPKRNKYGNIRKEVDGMKFDSIREAHRYNQLILKHKAGIISKPVLQYEFQLVGCSYVCDFLYLDYEKKEFVIEDAKGTLTDVYKIKRKMMKEIYGITILET
jgi:hypothetical protein